jgi:hypothetical protein
MKNITLETISIKLMELDEKYGEIYPKFKVIEMQYVNKFDQLLMQAQSQFTNQPSREAAARELISMEPIYEEYNTLATEVRVIETRMRNLQQISKNLVSSNWMGGGGYNE